MEKLVLIDGNSLLNRTYYATRPLTTRDGTFIHEGRHADQCRFRVCEAAFKTHLRLEADKTHRRIRSEGSDLPSQDVRRL